MLLGDETLILKVQHNETIRASLWNDEMIRILQDDIGVGEALLPCPSQKPLLYTSFHNIHLSIGSLQTKKPQSATLATYGTLRMSLAFPHSTLLTHPRPASCNHNCQHTNIEEIAPSTQRHNQIFGTALSDACDRKLLKGEGCFIGCLGVKLASVSVSASTVFWSHFLQRWDADAVHRFE
jgi:hypothetical protein